MRCLHLVSTAILSPAHARIPLTKNWLPLSVKNFDPFTEMVSMALTEAARAEASRTESMVSGIGAGGRAVSSTLINGSRSERLTGADGSTQK